MRIFPVLKGVVILMHFNKYIIEIRLISHVATKFNSGIADEMQPLYSMLKKSILKANDCSLFCKGKSTKREYDINGSGIIFLSHCMFAPLGSFKSSSHKNQALLFTN